MGLRAATVKSTRKERETERRDALGTKLGTVAALAVRLTFVLSEDDRIEALGREKEREAVGQGQGWGVDEARTFWQAVHLRQAMCHS